MDCRTARSWLSLRQDGELPEDREETLAAHLGDCPGCSAAAHVNEEIGRHLAARTAPEAPAGFAAAVVARLGRSGPTWFTVLPLLRTAAAAAVLLFLGTGAAILLTKPAENPAPLSLTAGGAAEQIMTAIARDSIPGIPIEEEDR